MINFTRFARFQGFMSEKPTQKYKQMHVESQNTASVADFDKIMNIKNEMELLVEKYPMLKSIDLDMTQIINQEGESLLPEYPPIFKIASLKEIGQ